MVILITLIQWIFRIAILLVVVDVIISYFMSPYSPFRLWLDRIVQPMLAPIRRVVPPIGMIDLSPLIFIVLAQLIESLLVSLLVRLA
jgi:YggT family protein